MTPVRVERPRVSYSDLERAPEDGRRYELYDGEVFVVPSPRPIHQVVADNIVERLRVYQRGHGGRAISSPIDIVFSEYDVVQPDVVFFEAARASLVKPDEPIRVAPDIAIEVLSPSTMETDRGKKMQLLARYGVPEYWLVDPASQTVEIQWLNGSQYLLAHKAGLTDRIRSTILPNLELTATEVFDF